MDQSLAFINSNGGVSICHPIEEARQEVVETPAVYAKEGDLLQELVLDDNSDVVTPEIIADGTEIITEALMRPQTDDEFIAWVAAKDLPIGTIYKVVNRSELPDSYFFNAYNLVDNSVQIDMVKARIFHVNQMRAFRAVKFIELGFPIRLNPDLEKAVISQDTQNILKSLRDIPQTIASDVNGAKSPEDLKKIWPDILS